jgi:lipoprotein-releasing system permease protein
VLPFEYSIGLRYTRAKRRNRFISVISIISIAGMAVGIWALIVVLSVMNGFQTEIRTRILSAASHVQVMGFDGPLKDWNTLAAGVARHPQVRGAAPFVDGQGLFSSGDRVQGGLLRGIVPELEDRVSEIASHMVRGSLKDLRPGEFGVVLGVELARSLGVRQDDRVTVIIPQGQVTAAGLLPRIRQFRVAGIFEIGMYEYDASLALVHMADAQKLYRLGEGVSGLRLKLADPFEAPRVTRELVNSLRGDVFASDWTRSHGNLFRAVQIEKRMMFIILTLIVLVAAFNIVSTLVMAVGEKQADIAILRTLGASPGSIMKIFVVQGWLIGVAGTLLGVSAGVLTAVNIDVIVPFIERLLGVEFMAKDVYQISELPSEVHGIDVALVAVMSLILGLVATLSPGCTSRSTPRSTSTGDGPSS